MECGFFLITIPTYTIVLIILFTVLVLLPGLFLVLVILYCISGNQNDNAIHRAIQDMILEFLEKEARAEGITIEELRKRWIAEDKKFPHNK